MNTSFAALKANREKNTDALTKKLTATSYDNAKDDTTWYPKKDEAGNGSAIVRFLPAPPGEEDTFVKIFTHGFQGPGGWYIENSRTTFGFDDPDPCNEYNQKTYKEAEKAGGKDEAIKAVSKTKRKLNYVSNVYIVKDPANPENNGKVFKYYYGQKVHDKLKAALNPEEDDLGEAPKKFDPFDMWEGANFRIRIKKVKGYPNYDASDFAEPAPLFVDADGEPDDDKMEAVWKMAHSLQAVIHPSQFKTYDELKKRLNRVLDLEDTDSVKQIPRKPKAPVEDDDVDEAPFETNEEVEEKVAPKTSRKPANKKPVEKEEEPDDMQWFKDLEQQLED